MPTYVYACNACGKQFEQFQSFKDEPLRTCLCGQEGSLRRVFQPVGIVFKGSGWYVTDSRKSDTASVGSASAVSTEVAKPEVTETKSEAAVETKSDTKSDTKTSTESSTPAS